MKYFVVSNPVAINKVSPETLRDALFANDKFYAFSNKKDAEKFALDGVKPKAAQYAVYEVEFDGAKGRKAASYTLANGEVLKKGVFVVEHAKTDNFTYTEASLAHVDAKKFKKALDVAAFEEEVSNEEDVEEVSEEKAEESNEEEVNADASLKDKAKAALNKAKEAATSAATKAKDAATSAATKAKDTATSVASTSTFKYAAGVTTAIAVTSAGLVYGNVVPSILALLAKSAVVAPYAAAFAAKAGVVGVAIASASVAVGAAIAVAAAGYGMFKLAKSAVSSYQQTAKEKYQAKLDAELAQIKDLKAKLDKKDRPFVNALDNLLSKAPEAKFKADGSEATRQPKVNKEMVAAFELDRLAKVVALSGAARTKAEKEVLAEATKTFKLN